MTRRRTTSCGVAAQATAAAETASTPPLGIAVPVLVQVVTAAGRRCECTGRGCHGRVERCERIHPQVRLIAAPRDASVPPHAAWRTPRAELAAWCERCFEHAQAVARRQRVTDAAARLAADALLEVDVLPIGGAA